ncbi:MAG: PepSY-associated TM helix domain-containing protein [Pseudomonadota bacterium]
MNTSTRLEKPRRAKTARRKLFDLHSWVGFQLAAFMTLVVATGTFAVIADEIDWLIHPELRSSSGSEVMDWGVIEAAVTAHAPDHVLTGLSNNEGSYFTYKATMVDPDGARYFLYIDPYTARVTGRTGTLTVQRFLRDLHRYLFMPSILGLPLVTTMAVVLLISLYTGMKTVRNWATVATRIRFSKGARVAVGDFHKFAGLWGIWFFVVIIVTSFWYFAELIGAVAGERFEPPRPGISEQRAQALGREVELVDAATLVATAEAALPGFRATSIQFSTRPTQAATVLGRHTDPLVRDRANRIFLDPADARIIHVQKSQAIGWVAYLNELADPLHFGSFGGLVTKLIWFVFGLAMLSLTLTGVWLTWKRLRSRSPTSAQWAFMPLVLVVTLFGVPYVQRHLDERRFEHDRVITQTLSQTMRLDLTLEVDPAGVPSGLFRLNLYSTAGRINLKDAELRNGQASAEPDSVQVTPVVLGRSVALHGRLNATVLSSPDLQLVLNFASGEQMVTQLAL